jgi:hypothetical protein
MLKGRHSVSDAERVIRFATWFAIFVREKFSMSDDLHEDDGQTSKLLYKNRQWAVTDYGVESLKSAPYYHFDKGRILETGNRGGEMYDWPLQMAEKTWVDIEAFIEIFQKAIDLHGYAEKVDKDMLSRSLEKARHEATRR